MAVVALLPYVALAQDRSGLPHAPAIESTTQRNPRGADVVEPMAVYRVTTRAGHPADTTYLGEARIPDPRLGQEGAYVRQDERTGTMIRISDAGIISENGLRRMVAFDPRAREDHLLFIPGPHDIVTSRQGVVPAESEPGRSVRFDIRRLYEAASYNPITSQTASGDEAEPRTALLRMESTYPGGEAVNLAVPLAPQYRPEVAAPIHIVRRDTTIFTPRPISYVLNRPLVRPQTITVIATLETGYGRRFVRTGIPAVTRPEFVTRGWADNLHVDGTVRLERPSHRWRIHLFGMSSLVSADVADVSHHQVALLGDLRFEYGQDTYVAIEAAGEMSDKPHQEFDWNSADYGGGLYVGPGRRAINARGLELHRIELMLGLRMGENRMIEVYQAGSRARGMGPELRMNGHLGGWRIGTAEVHLRGRASAYTIGGRGARDDGFSERALHLGAELSVGQEFMGMFVFAGARAMARREKVRFPGGSEYFMNDALATPAVGVEMRL